MKIVMFGDGRASGDSNNMKKDKVMPEKITVYGHPACPMVPSVLGMLKSAGIDYNYVNIFQDTEGRAHVREINHGNHSVPTLVFPDGSTLTEPSGGVLSAKLVAMGYEVPLLARIVANLPQFVVLLVIVYAVLSLLGSV